MTPSLYRSLPWLAVLLLLGLPAWAAKNKENPNRPSREEIRGKLSANCDDATAQAELNVNNVRARIFNAGDMWWDLENSARYEVPKVEAGSDEVRRHSLFAGSLWIGGFDPAGELRLAAMTYRQNGTDFFPGPIDTINRGVTESRCLTWDRIFEVTREEIEGVDEGQVSEGVLEWPVSGDPAFNESQNLAPFTEPEGQENFVYEPERGDKPDINGADQGLFYVYNDVGNIHTESEAAEIGLELRTLAFAYVTDDQVNNMTFYETTVINRSTTRLDSTFFGQWVDPDLGFAFDDYVGCDIDRGLGICYNGDNFDDGVFGYGTNPPTVGVDFFQGPLADPNDGIDNNRNGIIDEEGEDIIMSKFVYYNNDFEPTGNPEEAAHYYNYLTGTWKDGLPIINNGVNGREDGASEDRRTDYMFPAPPESNDGWNERNAGNPPGDRRFLQSAGPFTLQPGAVNEVTVGVIWAEASFGGPIGSINLLRQADDRAQELFNNDFDLLRGPDPPTVEVRELDGEIILTLVDYADTEGYSQKRLDAKGDSVLYEFQGYRIYQRAEAGVGNTTEELSNPDNAREIFQVDIEDEIDVLINESDDDLLGVVQEVEVNGNNQGIRRTFRINTDVFAQAGDSLVNYSPYHFTVVSYAATENEAVARTYVRGDALDITAIPRPVVSSFTYTQNAQFGDQPEITRVDGVGNGGNYLELTQETIDDILANGSTGSITYESGNGPITVEVYDPLKIVPGSYRLRVLRGGNLRGEERTQLTDSATWELTNLTTGVTYLSDRTVGEENQQVFSDLGITVEVRDVLAPFRARSEADNGHIGDTLIFENPDLPWLSGIEDNDVTSGEQVIPGNWIREGTEGGKGILSTRDGYEPGLHSAVYYPPVETDEDTADFVDPNSAFGEMAEGIIAPYTLGARAPVLYPTGNAGNARRFFTLGPVRIIENNSGVDLSSYYSPLQLVESVDLVFTSNKDHWSRSIVLEMAESYVSQNSFIEEDNLSRGQAQKFSLRDHPSWNDPNAIDDAGNPVYDSTEIGRSYFPGYAIDVETGERLNIMFGESSYLASENGNDMLWNPTSTENNDRANGEYDFYQWGGKHWVYVMNSRAMEEIVDPPGPDTNLTTGVVAFEPTAYDGCQKLYEAWQFADRYDQVIYNENARFTERSRAQRAKNTYIGRLMATSMYTMLPMLAEGFAYTSLEEGLIPSQATIKLRSNRDFEYYNIGEDPDNTPEFTFDLNELAVGGNENYVEQTEDMMRMVPNPYRGYSQYESSKLDNRVRITNLPPQCVVEIFNLKGSLIRRLVKNDDPSNPTPYIDWDIRNTAGIPIGSGIYLVRVHNDQGIDRTMKFVCMQRPQDLDVF